MKRAVAATPDRQRIASGAPWEATVGYSRAVRSGRHVFVAGTVAPEGERPTTGKDAGYRQARAALGVIEAALRQAGGSFDDVVRTRLYVTDIRRWEEFGRAHFEAFHRARPAATMVQVERFIPADAMIEIEADAVLRPPRRRAARPSRAARSR